MHGDVRHLVWLVVIGVAGAACGGGVDGGGTPPVLVASVVITTPASSPTFATLGRTVQFAAQAKDGSGSVVSGAAVTWSSSNTGAAIVSGTGLVTAVANGTSQITASSGGRTSPSVAVTVAQVVSTFDLTPSPVLFGAIGSTHQLTATVRDSSGTAIPSATVSYARSGPGTSATVSATGLVTAVAIGGGDSAVATSGSNSAKVQIVVDQVVKTITMSSAVAGPDTVFVATRTRQFTATATDSNNNVISLPPFVWSSSATAVATVSASGLVTAVADGSAGIQAAVGAVTGTRTMIVRRLPATHSITPPNAMISVNGGTQSFAAVISDSAGIAIPITWVSRFTGVLTVDPSSGTGTVATAVGNGAGRVVTMIPAGPVDSAAVTVSGQTGSSAPLSITVEVGNNFFRSARNTTRSPALDSVAVNGVVTWTWVETGGHGILSTGTPSFTSQSGVLTTGGYGPVSFSTPGTYTYVCSVHPISMTGTIVVR